MVSSPQFQTHNRSNVFVEIAVTAFEYTVLTVTVFTLQASGPQRTSVLVPDAGVGGGGRL